MILALNMPPGIPLWIPVLGGVFAIIVVKQLYGGLGPELHEPGPGGQMFLTHRLCGQDVRFTYNDGSTTDASGASKGRRVVDIPAMFIGKIPGNHRRGIRDRPADRRGLLLARRSSPSVPAAYLITFAVFVFDFRRTRI